MYVRMSMRVCMPVYVCVRAKGGDELLDRSITGMNFKIGLAPRRPLLKSSGFERVAACSN